MNQTAKTIVWAVAALTLVWMLVRLSVGIQAMSALRHFGTVGVDVDVPEVTRTVHSKVTITIPDEPPDVPNIDSFLVFEKDAEWPFNVSGIAIPRAGDTLLSLEGKRIQIKQWKEEIKRPRAIGTRVPITFRHDGEVHHVEVPVTPVPAGYRQILWIFLGVSSLVGFLYFGIGLFTLYRQGDSAQARVLALLNLALGMFVYRVLPGTIQSFIGEAHSVAQWQQALLDGIGMLALFGTAYWLHLALAFPYPSRIIHEKRWLAYLYCYLPPVVLVLLKAARRLSGNEDLLEGVGVVAVMAMIAQFIAALILLRRKRKRAANTLERRQLGAVFWGIMLGPVIFMLAVAILVGIVVISGVGEDLSENTQTMLIGGVLFALCLGFLPIPVSFIYAFQKYRLMEVELKLRRGTRFAMVTASLLIVFFAVLLGVTGLLLNTFAIESRTAALTVALVLALGFAPVQRRTHNLVERRFFPERNRLKAMLSDVLASATTMPDRVALWDHLENGLKEGMPIASVIPVLNDPDRARLHLPGGQLVPIDPGGPLMMELSTAARPLFVDEALSTGRVTLTPEETEWLKHQRATVLLPMIIHGRLTGFAALAYATSHEELSAENLSLLASVVSQVALQSETLRLMEENLEKRRLEEQLAMAREVQQHFLPQEMPFTPGLDLAVHFRPSLEVAGDYYDIIPLAHGKTLLAVADVSGKGAGAAMVMANVQASLRSMARAGVSLNAMVQGINDVLCISTMPQQFVTFFAAVYDAYTNTLTSVNAGHNPPRLLRASGQIEELSAGGPCLGVVFDAEYEQETLSLRPGDTLVLFTDGVSEAMNPAQVEFGEEHIARVALSAATKPAHVVADTVERAVTEFCDGCPIEDDFTLMIARIIEVTVVVAPKVEFA